MRSLSTERTSDLLKEIGDKENYWDRVDIVTAKNVVTISIPCRMLVIRRVREEDNEAMFTTNVDAIELAPSLRNF